ncbi:MAG: YqaJ viral recombinase family protein [Paeniclostridium sp.]|nr:YqaJ viral recombinase family protein [Paeniclostridium sp.]MBW4864205.1 YqaJ viral recombinase family protein [Paeniclostridium sp.]MBW4873708.1 YqaJ viral recombinase family protein [Paeniclostridium sp.]
MELGNKLEEFVAREFSLITGKKVRNVNGILKNNKYPFALANIDRSVVGEKAFLECKVTNSYGKQQWKKAVPIHYQIQMVHYMAVTGATHCYVAVLIGNEELVIHKIERDEEVIKQVMELEEMFWDKCVLGGNLPIPDGSDDYSKALQGFYKDSKNEELILFEEESFIDRYDELCELLKEGEKEKKTIEQYIQGQMKEYEIAYLGDRKITWKTQSRNSLDTKRLKRDHPELVEEYMKTTTSRVFRI